MQSFEIRWKRRIPNEKNSFFWYRRNFNFRNRRFHTTECHHCDTKSQSKRKPDVFKYRKMYPERGATLSGSRLWRICLRMRHWYLLRRKESFTCHTVPWNYNGTVKSSKRHQCGHCFRIIHCGCLWSGPSGHSSGCRGTIWRFRETRLYNANGSGVTGFYLW